MKLVAFQISDTDDRQLRVRAAQQDLNRSEAIREAVKLWLAVDPILSGCCDRPTIALDGVRYCIICGGKFAPVEVE